MTKLETKSRATPFAPQFQVDDLVRSIALDRARFDVVTSATRIATQRCTPSRSLGPTDGIAAGEASWMLASLAVDTKLAVQCWRWRARLHLDRDQYVCCTAEHRARAPRRRDPFCAHLPRCSRGTLRGVRRSRGSRRVVGSAGVGEHLRGVRYSTRRRMAVRHADRRWDRLPDAQPVPRGGGPRTYRPRARAGGSSVSDSHCLRGT